MPRGCRGVAAGCVETRADHPDAIGADARCEQLGDRSLAEPLDDDDSGRDEVGGAPAERVARKRAHAGVGVRRAMLPRRLPMHAGVLLAGARLIEGDVVRRGVAGPLAPSDETDQIAWRWAC